MFDSKYVFLQRENMPCYYELSFDAKVPALILKVHEDFVKFLPPLKGAHVVETLLRDFKFSCFSADWLGEKFGFNGCFKRLEMEDNFLVFSAEIPVLEKFRMQMCHYCQGHKINLLFGGDCLVCNATGQEKKMKECFSCKNSLYPEDCHWCKGSGKMPDSWMDHDSLYAVSATFTVFFSLMWFGQQVDKFVSCKKSQLLFVETSTIKEMGGAPVYGVYGITFIRWLRQLAPGHIKAAEEAMKTAWQKMNGSEFEGIDKMNTWCKVRENGWLSINCPGDRTGLYPAYHGLSNGEGYEFSCHNVDNPRQQLTLLACLGALCDIARKEIN